MIILCAKGTLLGRDISRPIVKYMGNIRREPKLFGRWQWRCDILLPLQQQLVSRGSVATRSPRLDRIWTVDTAHSMRQGLCNCTVSIRLSLRLSVCPICRPLHAAATGLLLWARRAGDIRRWRRSSGVSAARRSSANASSVTLSADVGS